MTIGVLSQVVLPNLSGIPRDSVVHTFAFSSAGAAVDDATLDEVHANLAGYYNTAGVSGWGAVGTFLSGVLSRAANACLIKSWRIPDARAAMGSPDKVSNFTLIAGANADNMPSEVALCVTRKAYVTAPSEVGDVEAIPTPKRAQRMGAPATHLGSTRPASRRRGRTYIGPLKINAVGNLATRTAEPAPDPHFIAALADAEVALGLPVGDGLPQAVFSRTDWEVHAVVTGQIDNAFDIIRKRGPRATGKTTW